MTDSNVIDSSHYQWDFFIAYATEDRDTVATPLVEALRSKGFKVWYDLFALEVGKSLLQSIDQGLRNARFGIVILSPNFFAKQWPMKELAGLHNRSILENASLLLPIWYKLSASDIINYSPILSDLVSVPWEMGIDFVVERIIASTYTDETSNPYRDRTKIYANVYRVLSASQYDGTTAKAIYENFSIEGVHSSLKSIVLKKELGVKVRIRALQSLIDLDLLENQTLNDLLTEPNTRLLREIMILLPDSTLIPTKEQIHLLLTNPRLPRATTGLGKMVQRLIAQGADYTSGVFLPCAAYPAWQVKYDCVRTIIEINDSDSLRTLAAFSTMSYWQARKRIVNYIQQLVTEGRVWPDEKDIAEGILYQIINDGKTEPKTPTMRHARGALAIVQEEMVNDKAANQQISILFLAADPTDASRLRLGEEFREINEQLKLANLRDHFKLELPQLSVRTKDISGALLNAQPQIVHFSGHGTSTGMLCFENQVGQTHLIQPDALAALFEQFAHQVNCVLLNACYSETQAKAIAEHIEYVIGMNQAIGDKAAIAFAIGFYQALGAGRTIEDAYRLGCVQIRLQGIPEQLTPVFIQKRATQS